MESSGVMMELDHVVYFSKQPPEIHVQKHEGTATGGRHKNWGTVNALTYTRDSYIEYLSVEHMEVTKQANHPLTKLLLHDLEFGEGWGTICFRTDNMVALDERLKSEGWKTSGVLNAERETSSGFVRKWKMLFIEQEVSNELPLPFFIEWEESFEERMNSLRKDGTLQDINERMQISQCVFAVKDPIDCVKEWSRLLNIDSEGHMIPLPNTNIVFQHTDVLQERLSIVKVTKD